MVGYSPTCEPGDHLLAPSKRTVDDKSCFAAAELFRALGDAARLRTLSLLMQGEMCVTDIAQCLDDSMPAVSQRLKLLRSQRIVAHRRAGKHVFYRLDDDHIAKLVSNALAHARE